MKKVKYLIIYFMLAGLVSSCKVDNFEGPDAGMHGAIIDEVTNQPVPSDIEGGTVLELIEHGYVVGQTAVTQSLRVKVDGTYNNSKIFAAKYQVRPVGNFVTEPVIDTVVVNGNTELNIKVLPFLRIKNVNVAKNAAGDSIIATFNIEKTTTDAINRFGLYVHENPNVGQPVQYTLVARGDLLPTVKVNNIDRVNPQQKPMQEWIMIGSQNTDHTSATVYKAGIALTANTKWLISGKPYYFRVGARSNATSNRFNYAPAIKLTL